MSVESSSTAAVNDRFFLGLEVVFKFAVAGEVDDAATCLKTRATSQLALVIERRL
jgi:hypothetical protein